MPKFVIKLKKFHDETGLTPYAVAKSLDLNQNTVRKYLTEDVEVSFLPGNVLTLIRFYGLDWRDPEVIEVIEEDDESPEIQTPSAA